MRIKLLPYQYDFIKEDSKYVFLRGALGCGKTWILCLWMLKRAMDHPNSFGLLAANSFSQVQRATLTTMTRILDEAGIGWRHNKLDQMLYLENGAKIKIHSLEAYNDLRGIEFSHAGIDEVAFASQEAWNVVIGRIRLKRAGPLQVKCVSTPNGFNWLYDVFAGESKTRLHTEIYGDSRLNYHLPEGYLESLRASYDPLTYKQEVLGQYVASTSGRKYYAFDRNVHVKEFDSQRFANAGLPAAAGFDFNVNPATAAIGWLINGVYYIADEVFQENSNTYNQCKEVVEKPYGVQYAYPDAAGKSRHSSSTTTDHAILNNAGLEVKAPRKNPPVKNRVNTANWLFSKNKVIIHPRCKKLIRDFEEEVWEKNPAEIGHIADAATYWFFYETPCQTARKDPSIIEW
jgi:hypothetical protein